VANCIALCLLQADRVGSSLTAAAAGAGDGGRGSRAAHPVSTSTTAIALRIEAVGSGAVLIGCLDVEPTSTVRSLKLDLQARLGLMSGLRLFLDHGGPELQVQRPVAVQATASSPAITAAEKKNKTNKEDDEMLEEDETLEGAGCFDGAVVVVLNTRALLLSPAWAAKLRGKRSGVSLRVGDWLPHGCVAMSSDGSLVAVAGAAAGAPDELRVFSLQDGTERAPVRGVGCDVVSASSSMVAVPGDGECVAVLDTRRGEVWAVPLGGGSGRGGRGGSCHLALRVPGLPAYTHRKVPEPTVRSVCVTTWATRNGGGGGGGVGPGAISGLAFVTSSDELEYWALTPSESTSGGCSVGGGDGGSYGGSGGGGGGGGGGSGSAAESSSSPTQQQQLECQLVPLRPVHPASGVAVTPDGQVLVAGGPDGRLRLWRARTGALLREVPMFNCAVSGVAVAADNETIAALLDSGTSVGVLRIPTLAALTRRGSGGSGGGSSGNNDDGDADQAVARGPLASTRLLARQISEYDTLHRPTGAAPASLCVSADGRSVAVSYNDRQCIGWSTETRAQQLNKFVTGQSARDYRSMPGRLLGFACGGDDYVVGSARATAVLATAATGRGGAMMEGRLAVLPARGDPWLAQRKFDDPAAVFGAELARYR
jgi:WD40 repeat protein